MAADRLRTYRQKRDFRRTPEPAGRRRRRRERAPIFVVQEHAARRHHYDVRLEIDGVLVSWACPKGPSTDPRVKRMAVPTEDHPLEYADFEGTIPAGAYGGGHVVVWDRGTWENVTGDGAVDAREALEQGHLVARLHGSKLEGAWVFQRIRDGAWLLVKRRDEDADPERRLDREDASVVSGRTLDDVAAGRKRPARRPRAADAETLWFGRRSVRVTHPDKVLFPADGITKRDLVEHARRVAPVMLPHTRGRAASLQVWPEGIDGEGFFLKRIPAHAPDWVARAELPATPGPLTYVVIDHVATLAWLAGQNAITPHVATSRVDRPQHPDRLIFDLDPSVEAGAEVAIREGALWLRDVLLDLDLVPWVTTSGSRGLHVHVPLDRHDPYDVVKTFAHDLAACLAAERPDTFTVAFYKKDRGGRVFVDVLRNAYGHTAAAPWSVRALPGAPVVMPLAWTELEAGPVHPRAFGLRDVQARLDAVGDPWRGMARTARRLSTRRARLDRRLERCGR